MKKIKFNQKLDLNKTMISKLNAEEQSGVFGGKKDEKTKTGPGVCTALPTHACCGDETKTGPDVCTAMPTFACCDVKTKALACTHDRACK